MDIATQYKKMAATGLHFRGLSIVQHADEIGQLITETGSTTLLDWGSGAGDQYRPPHDLHKRWGVARPALYDPAFGKLAVKPRGVFHGVLSTDVLEHVKETRVDAFIGNLFAHAERFVFASVCSRPAGKTFSNGRNLHITLHPYEWWREKFEAAGAGHPGVRWKLMETL